MLVLFHCNMSMSHIWCSVDCVVHVPKVLLHVYVTNWYSFESLVATLRVNWYTFDGVAW